MKAQLSQLLPNSKFLFNGKVFTVYQQGYGMTEVYGNGRFWAWPHYNGKEFTKVELPEWR